VISQMSMLVVTLFFQTASCGHGSWLAQDDSEFAFGFECQTARARRRRVWVSNSRGTKCPSSASSSPPKRTGHRECRRVSRTRSHWRACLSRARCGGLSAHGLRQPLDRPSGFVNGPLVVGDLLDKAKLTQLFAQYRERRDAFCGGERGCRVAC